MTYAMTNDVPFWNKIAANYAKAPVSDPDAYAHTLARTRAYLEPSDKVLEVGCGTGTSAVKLADAVADYMATDFSPAMIAIAQEKGQGVDNLDFGVSDMTLEDYADKDAVLAFNLLHLVIDLDAALSRVNSVLKPGGLFISKTPCVAGQWYLRPIIGAMQLFGKAPRLLYLTPERLDIRIKAAGFEILEVAEHNKQTRGHFVVARKL